MKRFSLSAAMLIAVLITILTPAYAQRTQRGKAVFQANTDGSITIKAAPGKSINLNGANILPSDLQTRLIGAFTRATLPAPQSAGRVRK